MTRRIIVPVLELTGQEGKQAEVGDDLLGLLCSF